ncbi:hypothetical protein [uncultured Pontibacter sp.]|uniref:hypothetical protein n=1 Tax=uncultured Pontibacter sp. TaxID=453356 RepID=UPI002601AB01|nr:hypothetical protein [uncultured Pontibacter sp.]
MNIQEQIQFPDILTANTFNWAAASNASTRRYNEKKRLDEVSSFFKEIGFQVHQDGDSVTATIDNLEVYFSYRESCKNVYKTFKVYRDGKKSNITVLRKYTHTRAQKINVNLDYMHKKAS